MKRILAIILFVFVVLSVTGCSFKDYNSSYKNEDGYSSYIGNRKSGCKDMNSFG